MSRFENDSLPQEGFAPLLDIGSIPGLSSPNAASKVYDLSTERSAHRIWEGDLITGTLNVVHEWTHMLPMNRNPKRAKENAQIVRVYLFIADLPSLIRVAPGNVPSLSESHTTGLSGWLDPASRFQHRCAYVTRDLLAVNF